MRALCPVCSVEWDLDMDPCPCTDRDHLWELLDSE